jgi:AmmeMemoRadiSam system protein A
MLMTPDTDRLVLLRLARESITAHVAGGRTPTVDLDGVCGRRGAAFVTLHARRELRGCIGHLQVDDPLGHVVPRCAIGACSRDPRFPAVVERELPDIEIEVSLLGPLESIEGASHIEIGRHGLVIELGWNRGLLLPQVAVEWKWDADEFLGHTCRKAGLPRAAWKDGAKLWRFEAEVFSEAGWAGQAG